MLCGLTGGSRGAQRRGEWQNPESTRRGRTLTATSVGVYSRHSAFGEDGAGIRQGARPEEDCSDRAVRADDGPFGRPAGRAWSSAWSKASAWRRSTSERTLAPRIQDVRTRDGDARALQAEGEHGHGLVHAFAKRRGGAGVLPAEITGGCRRRFRAVLADLLGPGLLHRPPDRGTLAFGRVILDVQRLAPLTALHDGDVAEELGGPTRRRAFPPSMTNRSEFPSKVPNQPGRREERAPPWRSPLSPLGAQAPAWGETREGSA